MNTHRVPAYGSDRIVECLSRSGVEYLALNPGASIRGLHESAVTFGGNHRPEVVLCGHEEIAVALAHGYAKATGRLVAVALHDVVGLLHASMAIFNAWCDRVPILLLGGTGPMEEARRRPRTDWIHTALIQGNAVREFVKWDTQVFGAEGIESTLWRAIKTATALPAGPVYVCFDVEDQEASVPPQIQEAAAGAPPGPKSMEPHSPPESVEEVARWLREAEAPVILTDYYNRGEPGAVETLVRLSEHWAIPVVDLGNRFNFPTQHPMCLTGLRDELVARADLIVAFDVRNLSGALRSDPDMRTRSSKPLLNGAVRIVSVGVETVPLSSWAADYFAWQPVDLEVTMRSSAFVKTLSEAMGVPPRTYAEVVQSRRERLLEQRQALANRWRALSEEAWEQRPISTMRLASELWSLLEGNDWMLTNCALTWPYRLWSFDVEHPHLGRSGGGGLGYGLGASLGAALACKGTGRVAVDIQGDGDLLYVPTALWTAAHYELPLLVVVHNNRAYYQDEQHQREIALSRSRPDLSATIGIRLEAPEIDFSGLARSMGVWADAAVTEPAGLPDGLRSAFRHVKETGKPALVDVISQPR